MLILGHGVLG